LPNSEITVIVPTLAAGEPLAACIASLDAQTFRDFETMVVDNSGTKLARKTLAGREIAIIDNVDNVGFGAAINQGIRASSTPFVAVLNDDAAADPGWLAEMLHALEGRPDVGMVAPQIRLGATGMLDSAGMLVCGDGSSRQRGHGEPVERYPRRQEVLLPSGCAALYRREMLDETGLFDPSFYLYCEDTDLGLRARWKGWECLYVPAAIVEHAYSSTAGRASATKAFYVERNRLFVLVKNFPFALLLLAPFCALARYFWHVWWMWRGRGAAAEFTRSGGSAAKLPGYVFRAWLAMLGESRTLCRERRQIRKGARLTPKQYARLLRRFSISPRQVARL
jgi:GT2 family glycosyltransferase